MPAIKPIYFLLIGILTITMAQLSVSIDLAGWIIYVPFLIYLRKTNGVQSKLIFVAALITGWSFCIAKIVSPPMPLAMVFLYSIPISIFHLPGFLVWDKWKDERWSALLFPAIMTVMEWVQYSFTPLASWGVAAYSQSHSLAMMQTVSLFGMAGLSFMIYWVNISIAEKIADRPINWQLPIALTLLLVVFGAIRYDVDKAKAKPTIRVAAVGTDSDITGLPLPSKEKNDKVKANLFSRTAIAAEGGAKLVVWNEASTFILPEEEDFWKDTLASLSKRLNVSLVAAYIVPTAESPLRYQNKYLFFDSTGGLMYTYNKHQPVPGEPASKGQEPFKVFDIAGVKTGAVICYDYDFPYIAKALGKMKTDLVAVPSSDWRGIDPLHSRMAAFRAVEQGHSIIRSTRFGLSAAITPYGELASQMSSYDVNNKIMIANLPAHRITTLYSIIGDVFVYCCIGLVFVLLLNYFNLGQF
jgi:apolipoprotein N-acyltransferase